MPVEQRKRLAFQNPTLEGQNPGTVVLASTSDLTGAEMHVGRGEEDVADAGHQDGTEAKGWFLMREKPRAAAFSTSVA